MSARRLRRRVLVTMADLVLQAIVIVLGIALAFHPHRLAESIHLGTVPSGSDLAFALTIAVIAFTGLEAAASLSGEVAGGSGGLKRLVLPGSAVIILIYVGISLVGVAALPVHHGLTELGQQHIKAPVLGVVEAFRPVWVADVLKYASRSAARWGWPRPPTPACSGSRGSATRWPPTVRSRARSAACTRAGGPRS